MANNIPPDIMALLDQLSQGGIAEDMNPLLAQQYETAGQMRKTPMPITNDAGRGGIVAANPMQQAAAAIQQYRGGQGQTNTMRQMGQNVGTTGQGLRALMMAKLLREYDQPTAPQAPIEMGGQNSPAWLSEDPMATPGLGAPGQEGPDITEGRPVPRPPRKPMPQDNAALEAAAKSIFGR